MRSLYWGYAGAILKIFKFKKYIGGGYFAFEPDENNLKELNKYIRENELKNIEVFDIGVSDKEDVLHFSSGYDVNSGAAIDEAGNVTIKVNSLDNILQDRKITFIKMDIEGAETQALEGAKNIINVNRPKLAICIYHSCHDMVNIPYNLMNQLIDYNFYIRHYNVDKTETVFYAIPK